MLPQINILEDDAKEWYQRLTFQIYGGTCVLGMIVFIASFLIKNIMTKGSGQRRSSVVLFYIFIELGFILRFLYCYSSGFMMFDPAIYGIWCFFPPVFTTTAIIFFLISMLNSLDEVYQTTQIQKFGRLRWLLITFNVVFWIMCISMYSWLAYNDINRPAKDSLIWASAFFYTSAGSNVLACALLLIITLLYVSELKKFTCTYRAKRTVIISMLIGTILQLFLRVLQGILNGSGVLTKLHEDSKDNINYHLYTCCYFFLSDLVPTIGYLLFMRKEDQSQFDDTDSTGSINGAPNSPGQGGSTYIPGLLERLYKRKETKKSWMSTTVRTELEDIKETP